MATGAYNPAYVLYQQKVNLTKAEEYAREALCIRIKIHGSNISCVGRSYDLLGEILTEQNKLGDETMVLYKRSIAIITTNEGPDYINIAAGNMTIGRFYRQLATIQPTVDSKQRQILLAKSHFEEARRIHLKLHGPTHQDNLKLYLT
jgi:hypothetical protein